MFKFIIIDVIIYMVIILKLKKAYLTYRKDEKDSIITYGKSLKNFFKNILFLIIFLIIMYKLLMPTFTEIYIMTYIISLLLFIFISSRKAYILDLKDDIIRYNELSNYSREIKHVYIINENKIKYLSTKKILGSIIIKIKIRDYNKITKLLFVMHPKQWRVYDPKYTKDTKTICEYFTKLEKKLDKGDF